jgi:hypothetical protein
MSKVRDVSAGNSASSAISTDVHYLKESGTSLSRESADALLFKVDMAGSNSSGDASSLMFAVETCYYLLLPRLILISKLLDA